MNEKKTKATFTISESLLREFRVESAREGRKMSNILEDFVREYVKKARESKYE